MGLRRLPPSGIERLRIEKPLFFSESVITSPDEAGDAGFFLQARRLV